MAVCFFEGEGRRRKIDEMETISETDGGGGGVLLARIFPRRGKAGRKVTPAARHLLLA
ncbi:hypothetical protein [Massilia sp. CCM 8734]|uniref:hypothetical protein n=1 Tax=Massilia sp. CCM 8734 TaxID=2609283 RepID=UPI0014224BBB|nr:hypothetical protein [Massilia sp. CCM 8734]